MFCDTMCTTLNSGRLQCFGLYFTWNDHRINNGTYEWRAIGRKRKMNGKERNANEFLLSLLLRGPLIAIANNTCELALHKHKHSLMEKMLVYAFIQRLSHIHEHSHRRACFQRSHWLFFFIQHLLSSSFFSLFVLHSS